MLKRVLAGGQTGGDVGGLLGAALCGIETGGTAPKGWRTDDGSNPALAAFGLVEHASADYLPRTAENVMDAQGTLFVGHASPGETATRRYAMQAHTPYLFVSWPPLREDGVWPAPGTVESVRMWAVRNRITILNVAGNRERTNPGIQQATADLVVALHPRTVRARDRMGSSFMCPQCGGSTVYSSTGPRTLLPNGVTETNGWMGCAHAHGTRAGQRFDTHASTCRWDARGVFRGTEGTGWLTFTADLVGDT